MFATPSGSFSYVSVIPEYAQCNPDLFRKFVPALSSRRAAQLEAAAPPPDPSRTVAWAIAEAKRLGIHDDAEEYQAGAQMMMDYGNDGDDGMDVDDSQVSRRKRKLANISPGDEVMRGQ